jgi:hypothetical protein
VLNTKPLESDFFRPFNPGNAAGFMPNSDPPNGNAGRGYNIGKSLYFNAEDPRRQVQLFPGVIEPGFAADGLMPTTGFNPLDCEWTGAIGSACAGSTVTGLPFFLTFNPSGTVRFDPNQPIDTTWNAPAGFAPDPVTGDKAIFGDLGDDYIVSGMGRVRVYGGWGFDLIDLRADTTVDNGLNDMPVPNSHNGAGSPDWESLAYGGAGQDIYFAGTGGDRLIDWVGNHNSYYVPFSQFGMPAVSRTLMPFLPEFLYALSKSDGADQTLGPRADAFCAANGSVGACSAYPKYSGAAARNGEPFGELGLVLQHDTAWHQQSGPPFNEMPENLGGVGVDVQKTANVMPFNSPGTCDYVSELAACAAPAGLSLSNGAGANLPSGTNTPGAASTPLLVTGTPGATITFTFTEGTLTASGTGVIGPTGRFGTSVDLSAWPDGTITVTATLNMNGKITTLTGTMGKNSVAPPAPAVSAPVWANLAGASTYSVTVTGQAGAIANVIISDSQLLPDQTNGMDFVGANGTIVIPVDVTSLVDGAITIAVTLTNGAGDSTATTVVETKDTVPPVLTVSANHYITASNVATYQPVFTGETGTTVNYTITDGVTTLTGSKFFNGSNKWQPSMNLTSLNDGPIVLTVTETDPAGNPTVVVTNLVKDTVAAAISYTISAPTNNGSYDVGNPILITYAATDADGVASVTGVLDGTRPFASGASIPVRSLAAGTHTIVFTAKDVAGNISTVTLTIQVHLTFGGLSIASGDTTNITSSATITQLQSLVSKAQSAYAAANRTLAQSYLAQFVTYVQSQSGVSINAAYAALLIGWAQDLSARL